MRVGDLGEQVDLRSASHADRCTDEIPEPVDCANGRIVEGRNEECAGEMGRVVLYEVNRREPLFRDIERGGDCIAYVVHLFEIPGAVDDIRYTHTVGDCKGSFFYEV